MRNLVLALTAIVAFAGAAPASAALPVGRAAPDFRTMGALNGKPFRLHLAEQLKAGPVVLYFYPKAFTKGCTFEARAFSEASPQFARGGGAGHRAVGGRSADAQALLGRGMPRQIPRGDGVEEDDRRL